MPESLDKVGLAFRWIPELNGLVEGPNVQFQGTFLCGCSLTVVQKDMEIDS